MLSCSHTLTSKHTFTLTHRDIYTYHCTFTHPLINTDSHLPPSKHIPEPTGLVTHPFTKQNPHRLQTLPHSGLQTRLRLGGAAGAQNGAEIHSVRPTGRERGRKGKVSTQIHSRFLGGFGQKPGRRAGAPRPVQRGLQPQGAPGFRSLGKHFPQDLLGYFISTYFTSIYLILN